MKNSFVTTVFMMLMGLVACQREVNPVSDNQPESKLVHKTFHVSVEETRTYLDENGKSIKWAEGDVINVIGVTAGGVVGQHSFTLKEGDGGKSFGTFEGTVNEEETVFYAIYPNYAVDETKIKAGDDCIILTQANLPVEGDVMQQKGYVDGFDPDFGILAAKADETGNLAFQHVMSFFKFKMGVDDVVKVTMSTTGDLRFGARVQYQPSTGAIETQSAKKAVDIVPAEGSTFVNGSTYLVAFPPRTGKKIKQFKLTYTLSSGVSQSLEVNNSDFKNLICQPGKIYNLGCPPISFVPTITFTAPDKLAYDATSGSFPYAVANPVSGQSVTATLESGVDWISNIVVGADAVTFTCSKNNATDAQERSAVITLHYTGAADVPVTVTQGIAGSIVEEHDWYFTDYTDAQMKAITGLEADAKATAGQTWNFGDGLTMVTNSSSKWNKQTIGGIEYKWVATGGKYGSNQKYFSFTTESAGTVTVLYASGGSASRALTLNVGDTETTDNANVSTGTSDLKTVTFASVAAGTVLLYSKDDNVRIFRITFHGDS